MYCVKCGVKLEDTEKMCPLCGTMVFHPDIKRDDVERLYPENNYPKQQINRWSCTEETSSIKAQMPARPSPLPTVH
jgi:hypothetical protein